MSDDRSEWNADDLLRAQSEAQCFRARRETVYPGRLLVMRAESFSFHPIDDEAFDPSTERLMGISVWGPLSPWRLGLALVGDPSLGQAAALISGDANRPSTGVGRLDAWIVRADALRKLKQGVAKSFGGIPLSRCQFVAAVAEIEAIVRETSINLLHAAPPDQRPALLALAQVADAERPHDSVLTEAIVELTASAPAWQMRDRNPDDDLSKERILDAGTGLSFAFQDADFTVLRELAEEHSVLRAGDMDGRSGMPGYDRLTDRLKAMEAANPPLVERPSGPRSGFRITDAGLRVLLRRDRISKDHWRLRK